MKKVSQEIIKTTIIFSLSSFCPLNNDYCFQRITILYWNNKVQNIYLPTLFQNILTLFSHSGSSSLGFTVGMSDFSAAGNIWSIPERSNGWNRLSNQILGITQLEHSPNSPINQIKKFQCIKYKIIFFYIPKIFIVFKNRIW